MSSLWETVRAENWWWWKIPPLLAIGYAEVALLSLPPWPAIAVVGGVLVSVCAVGAHGHIVNDIFDVREDGHRGKPNAMAALSPGRRIAWVAALWAVGFGPLLWIELGTAAVVTLMAAFALPAAYSIPPLRLKERGWVGVVADAGGAHALPALLMVVSLVHIVQAVPPVVVVTTGTALLWWTMSGFRGIISHQFTDRQADESAGTVTFGTRATPRSVRLLLFRLVLPIEAAAVAGFMAALLVEAPVAAILTLPYFVSDWALVRYARRRRYDSWHPPAVSEGRAPRLFPLVDNKLYEVWLPLALAVQTALLHPPLWFVPVVHALAFFPNVAADMRDRTDIVLWLRHRKGDIPGREASDIERIAARP